MIDLILLVLKYLAGLAIAAAISWWFTSRKSKADIKLLEQQLRTATAECKLAEHKANEFVFKERTNLSRVRTVLLSMALTSVQDFTYRLLEGTSMFRQTRHEVFGANVSSPNTIHHIVAAGLISADDCDRLQMLLTRMANIEYEALMKHRPNLRIALTQDCQGFLDIDEVDMDKVAADESFDPLESYRKWDKDGLKLRGNTPNFDRAVYDLADKIRTAVLPELITFNASNWGK